MSCSASADAVTTAACIRVGGASGCGALSLNAPGAAPGSWPIVFSSLMPDPAAVSLIEAAEGLTVEAAAGGCGCSGCCCCCCRAVCTSSTSVAAAVLAWPASCVNATMYVSGMYSVSPAGSKAVHVLFNNAARLDTVVVLARQPVQCMLTCAVTPVQALSRAACCSVIQTDTAQHFTCIRSVVWVCGIFL
jgi:hypothetical protein